jgi:hypothetical protein
VRQGADYYRCNKDQRKDQEQAGLEIAQDKG